MKKKINRMLVFIATLAIGCTMILLTFVYYDLFRKQVLEDLRAYAMLMRESEATEQVEVLGGELDDCGIRLTLIGADGSVLFDNEADQTRMENHSERPEIAEALQSGEGYAVRKSETLAASTFYYAVRLDNQGVLRVSKDAGSIYSVFFSALPILLGVLVILVILCMILAHFLTGNLIRPIEHLAQNLDDGNESSDYEELTPFISMIQEQHRDIMKNAQMRQEFTANVSHELKTPLTSISGYAELIETGMASDEDVTRFAHGIHNSANRLLTLINDIIRLSQLDASEQQASFETLDLYDMAETCVDMLSMNAEKHRVSISLMGEPCQIQGNRQMIEELLYNLCDNAIRYNNPGGSVTVEVWPKKQETNGTEEKILVVRDTGIGIPKEHQERIFERFYRVDKSRSKSTGGTGLGLAIVKHIIAIHNADMKLVSEEGKGTSISVIFSN